jgi:exodeoxyribonuclease III
MDDHSHISQNSTKYFLVIAIISGRDRGKMKIISWNCKMAYRKKAEHILRYHPDLVIVQECEKFEESPKTLWFGNNPKKGIGIFAYSDFKLEVHDKYSPSFRYVIPIKVSGPKNFNLFAVWAMNDTNDIKKRYIGQVYSALSYYDELLYHPSIIIGDFNWNAIWDIKPTYPLYGNLSDVISILSNKGIRSIYHEFYGEDFGKEKIPTFYMHHNQNKPYHIDYCFVSSVFKASYIEVGNFSDWIGKSDHVPIVLGLDLEL